MHIEKQVFDDGSVGEMRRLFSGAPDVVKAQLLTAYTDAMRRPETVEVKQVRFDLDSPCPCGMNRKAKNCCAKWLVKKQTPKVAEVPQ